MRQLFDSFGLRDRIHLEGLPIVLKLKAEQMQSPIIDVPRGAIGLVEDGQGMLGVAAGLIAETSPVSINLKPTLHD